MNSPEASLEATPLSSSAVKRESPGSLFLYFLAALAIALFVRFFVAEPFIVSGASMDTTFQNLQYLIVDRLVYRFSEPVRGDVVVFKFPTQTTRDLIKRVIGLPGETVQIEGSAVTIFNDTHPDGLTLEEPYVSPENKTTNDHLRVTLKAHEYFVLGDNRKVSADSRLWGVLPQSDIIGRVDLRLFPITKISIVPGEARY